MNSVDFEPIYSAFWDYVKGLSGIVTKSRRVKHWSDVPAEEQPALFMGEDSEDSRQTKGLTAKNALLVRLFLYVHAGEDENAVPATLLNLYLYRLRQLLEAENVDRSQTLNGLVSHAWVTHVEKDAGILGGQAVAIIDVEIFF